MARKRHLVDNIIGNFTRPDGHTEAMTLPAGTSESDIEPWLREQLAPHVWNTTPGADPKIRQVRERLLANSAPPAMIEEICEALVNTEPDDVQRVLAETGTSQLVGAAIEQWRQHREQHNGETFVEYLTKVEEAGAVPLDWGEWLRSSQLSDEPIGPGVPAADPEGDARLARARETREAIEADVEAARGGPVEPGTVVVEGENGGQGGAGGSGPESAGGAGNAGEAGK